MSFRALKTTRVLVSLFFFLGSALVLLDFLNLFPSSLTRTILFLQFTPSLIKFIALAGTGAVGFIFVLLLTVFAGRVYCSTICPLGTLQDIFSFIARKVRLTRFHGHLESHSRIHLAFLIVTILPLALGSLFAVTLLDPFSNFGRLLVSLVRPMVLFINNSLAFILQLFNRYDLNSIEINGMPVLSVLLPVLFLTLIGWMSIRHGRLYCNSVCPVGSLLRLIARYSLFRIVIKSDLCKSCQLCERVCKAGCIDRKQKTVDFERCVGCYNCFTACPSDGLVYERSFKSTKDNEPDVNAGRRTFLLGSPFLFLAPRVVSDTLKVVKPQKDSTVPERKHFAVTPPGSSNLRHFTQTCTACHVCISACPSQVLRPSILQYGLAGLFQPTMDFDASYCTFECTACTEVCPSGALQKLTVEDKKIHQAGKAIFLRENCVVFTENTDCGACSEHCPTKAVTMVPYKNSRIPEVNSDYCIGCGACEHACPTRPYRAIFVDGKPVHGIARKKEPEKRQELKLDGDFPF